MINIKEDGFIDENAVPQTKHMRIVRHDIQCLILSVIAAAVPVEIARAQSGDDASEFRASVLEMSGMVEQITVPLNGSVTVDATVEVERADVVTSTIADVQVISPTRLLITGRGYGMTNIVLTGADSKQYVLEVSVELDLRRLNTAIQTIDPRSHAQAESVLGNIILTGTSSSAGAATRIVELAELFLPGNASSGKEAIVQNHLEVSGEQQVLLRCIVAEVARSAARELGVNGFLAGENFKDGFLINQIGGINPINIGAAADALITENIPFLTGSDGIPLGPASTISLGFPRVQMQLFIRAMVDNSLVKVLAEPNLVTISGETATFLAGGEFPYPVPQGNQAVTIEFKKFGVQLSFTPYVRGQQRIRLTVAPEVSELNFSTSQQIEGFVVPGIRSRAASTTVDLFNGETIAIAGLLSEQLQGIATRVPGIGELPVLGALFRSVKFQRSMTELVIMVTPEIVAPMDTHQVAAMKDAEIKEPSDFELYALGLLEGQDDADAAGGDLGQGALTYGTHGLAASEPDNPSVHGLWGHAAPTQR